MVFRGLRRQTGRIRQDGLLSAVLYALGYCEPNVIQRASHLGYNGKPVRNAEFAGTRGGIPGLMFYSVLPDVRERERQQLT
jgi:hypothetical protein